MICFSVPTKGIYNDTKDKKYKRYFFKRHPQENQKNNETVNEWIIHSGKNSDYHVIKDNKRPRQ